MPPALRNKRQPNYRNIFNLSCSVNLQIIKLSEDNLHSATAVEENGDGLRSAFPSGWCERAQPTGAIKHGLKDFQSVGDLLRVRLIPIGKGDPLRETAVIAREAGIADISDVAILKRLRKSEFWFLALCKRRLAKTGVATPPGSKAFPVRMVEGSIRKEPGKTASQWRVH